MRAEARDKRDEVLTEVVEAASRLPVFALLPLLPFLGALSRDRPRPLTSGMVRRALGRWRLVQRFAELKASPEHCDDSNRQVIHRVCREASRVAPGVRCSQRSLERWIHGHNAVGPDGLAAGMGALIDSHGNPQTGNIRLPESEYTGERR